MDWILQTCKGEQQTTQNTLKFNQDTHSVLTQKNVYVYVYYVYYVYVCANPMMLLSFSSPSHITPPHYYPCQSMLQYTPLVHHATKNPSSSSLMARSVIESRPQYYTYIHVCVCAFWVYLFHKDYAGYFHVSTLDYSLVHKYELIFVRDAPTSEGKLGYHLLLLNARIKA